MSRLVRNPEGESGAVAVIVTVCLILLFLLVSLAIDLGFARADVRNNQTISDFASIAAADGLRDGNYEHACIAAVNYVFANATELTSGSADHMAARATCATDPDLQDLIANGCEDETAPLTAPVDVTISASPYTITFTTPVPDDDPAMIVEGQAINDEIDGGPCDRVKVTVVRQRDYIFGPAAGNISGNPAADAVAVYFEVENPDEIASLIVLEQKACLALTANGSNAKFLVTDSPPDANGVTFPGRITVDSDGTGGSGNTSCSPNNRYTIHPQQGTICAEGDVGSHALGAGDATKSHPPGTGTANCVPPNTALGLGVEVIPRPTRYGRRSVDWLVNCRTAYPAWDTSDQNRRYPIYGDTPACPTTYGPAETPLPPFLDNLYTEIGLTGTPAGFHTISNCSGDLTDDGHTKIHLACDPAGADSITFNGVTHVVFDDPIDQNVSAPVTITGGSAGAVVFFRDEGIRRTSTGAVIDFQDVFAYVHTATGLGIGINGGDVTWNGLERTFVNGKPQLHAQCDPLAALPTAACFAPLALWSNSDDSHHFGGGGNQFISGSYFIPNANIELAGSGSAFFNDAQFYGRTMVASGNGAVELTPNRATNVPDPDINFGLIR